MQEVADARRIRNRILLNFELATQVTTSEEERRRLLHFVVVGGGPTGVEFGAELYDFLKKVHVVSASIRINAHYSFCRSTGAHYMREFLF